MVTWSLLPFVFHVNVILHLSETVVGDLCPQQQSFSGLLSLGQLHQVWICKSFDGPCVESINDSDKQSSVTKRS